MLLSRLVYNAIKSVKYLDDKNFTYDGFKKGDFDDDVDYSSEINNVYDSLNRVIHELSDAHKIPFKVAKVYKGEDNLVPINGYGLSIKTIVNIFYLDKDIGDYVKLEHRNVGTEKLFILGECPDELYIEYIEDIPNFDEDSYKYASSLEEEQDVEFEEYDVDLKNYGINETMCSYIELYVKGALFMDISPDQGVYMQNEAKRQISNLDEYQTTFAQKKIKKVFGID